MKLHERFARAFLLLGLPLPWVIPYYDRDTVMHWIGLVSILTLAAISIYLVRRSKEFFLGAVCIYFCFFAALTIFGSVVKALRLLMLW
jgi:hypothetical protein